MKRLVADPEATSASASAASPTSRTSTRVETLGQIDLKLAAEHRRHHARRALRAQSRRSIAGRRTRAARTTCCCPSTWRRVFRQNIGQLTPEQRLSATLYTVQAGRLGVLGRAQVQHHDRRHSRAQRPADGRAHRRLDAARALRRRHAAAEGAARRRARRWPQTRAAAAPHVHVVRRGDSLWRIARRNGMNVNTLAMMNGMQPERHAARRPAACASALAAQRLARRARIVRLRRAAVAR